MLVQRLRMEAPDSDAGIGGVFRFATPGSSSAQCVGLMGAWFTGPVWVSGAPSREDGHSKLIKDAFIRCGC